MAKTHLLDALSIVGGKKVLVLNYLLKNQNSQKQVIATQRKIAKEAGISLQTVRLAMKALQDANVISQLQAGVYVVSPDIEC